MRGAFTFVEKQVFNDVAPAGQQCGKQPLEGENDMICLVRPVIYDDRGRILGDQAIDERSISLRADFDPNALFFEGLAALLYIHANNQCF